MKLPTVTDGRVLLLGTLAVAAVTGIAAVNSYDHIETLALAHGQTLTESRLLPLSVDGLVAAASLQLVYRARTSGETYWLAWVTLVLGVAATLAANVAAGWSHGAIGAASSGWPALAFILAAELSLGTIRKRTKAARTRAPATAPTAAAGRHAGRSRAASAPAKETAAGRPAAAQAIVRGSPDTRTADVAELFGVAERTARRWLQPVRADAGGAPPANGQH